MSEGLKSEVLKACGEEIDLRIKRTQSAISDAQNSANSETKSTAGDKHDTARAMAQLEVEKHAKQLAEIQKLKQMHAQLTASTLHSEVGLGSLVKANGQYYYIGLSLGKMLVENQSIFAISLASPLAQAMKGHQQNEKFSFNGISFTIEKIS